MLTISNANNKKACRVDPASRTVEVVNRNLKVTVEFLKDGRTKVTCFNEDGSVAVEKYIAAA